MADFRRWIIALAVLACFAGLANAQLGGGGSGTAAFTCQGAASVTPTLRSEGFTEQTGDIVLSCTGGVVAAVGSTPTAAGTGGCPTGFTTCNTTTPLATANITLILSSPVTSRLLPTTAFPSASEASLLIDEPGSGLQGQSTLAPCAGPAAPQGGSSCTNQTTVSSSNGVALGTATAYQGVVSGNTVSFQGVPILPPGTGGQVRIYRITNVRTNANGGGTQVNAQISLNSASAIPISQSTLTVGFIQSGMTPTVVSLGSLAATSSPATESQCGVEGVPPSFTSPSKVLRMLSYAANFPTAFKPAGTGTGVAGAVTNTESGFASGFTATGGLSAGNASFGTRVKATFANIPAGYTIWVPTANVSFNIGTGGGTTTGVTAASATQAYAQLASISGDTGGGVGANAVAGTTTIGGGTVTFVPLTATGGTATATWEVVGGPQNQNNTLYFPISSTFIGSAATNTPAAGIISLIMNFAPSPSGGAFTATSGATALSSPIPRFADVSPTKSFITINICRTVLLYPFITNLTGTGYDTGLAIENTTADPFTSAANAPQVQQAGTCTLNFYGTNPPTAPITTMSIAAGQGYTTVISSSAPGFQGYIIAVCGFQDAHGFAFIGAQGNAVNGGGYVALMLPDPGPTATFGRTSESTQPPQVGLAQ